MPAAPGGITLTGDLATIEAASVAWIERASPEEKDRIRAIFTRHNTSTIAGVNAMAHDMVVEILVGGISPSLAVSVKPWIELIAANLWQQDAAVGQQNQTPAHVAQAILEVRERVTRVTPAYRSIPESMPEPDVIEAPERAKASNG